MNLIRPLQVYMDVQKCVIFKLIRIALINKTQGGLTG